MVHRLRAACGLRAVVCHPLLQEKAGGQACKALVGLAEEPGFPQAGERQRV